MESVDFSIAGTGIKVKRAEPVCVSAETCKASKTCARGCFLFFLESKKPERHALRLEEFGLQFAVQNGIDDDMADGEVVLHRGGEDIGGFNAGLGREGIHEVRIPQALRRSAVHEHIFFIEIPPRFCLVKVCFTTWPYYTHFYVKNQAKMNFLNKQNSNMAEFIRK